MSDSATNKEIKFGFGKPKVDEQKISDVENKVLDGVEGVDTDEVDEHTKQKPISLNDVEEKELDAPYVDKRSITIALVRNYSKFREANRATIQNRVDYIGSSITSSKILSSNKREIETYFPNIIGLSPNNPDFMMRVKEYLNNIQIKVDELGKTFDTSFHYNHKRDYIKVLAREEAIEKKYKLVDRQDTSALRKALKVKINEINTLEVEKCAMGYPINVEDYLMYRHCLLYNSVAKDMSLINEDKSVRFYFKDNQKEELILRRKRMELNNARANYVSLLADNDKFEAVYIQYCLANNLPVLSSLVKDSIVKEAELDKFSTEEPTKFNKLCNDRDIILASTVENLIARGILNRSTYSQNVTDIEGNLIGANMGEVIAYFKRPENNPILNTYLKQLKG